LNRRIDPYSVRLFVSAARAGSIVRAAEQEHIAPSALSRRLADLERAFGTPLLVRSPRGVVPTDAGQLVLARGEKIDEDLKALLREVQTEGREVRGTVRLYANMSGAAALRRPFAPTVSVSSFDAVCRMVEAGLGIAVIPQSAAAAYAGTERFVRRPLDEPWAARDLCMYALRKSSRSRAVTALIEQLRG
jgi:DNA-binding transcriptional LysR family regulator